LRGGEAGKGGLEITVAIVIAVILGTLGGLAYLVPRKRPLKRGAEIKQILSDLESLKSHPDYKDGVKINIEFFKAIRNPFSYIWWLIFRAPRLRKNRARILELADLPFSRWQRELLETLSWFEIWMPRVLRPIRKQIIQELERLKKVKKEPIVVASLGCGGMELERQIIYQLLRMRFRLPLIFIGVDYSPSVPDVLASKFANLASKGLLEIKTISHLGTDELNKLKAEAASRRFVLVLLNADAFQMKELAQDSFDLVYHTRLRHHLTLEEGRKLDELAIHLAPKFSELDDLFSISGIITMSLFLWRFPALLNGGILSSLRDFSKKELLLKKEEGWKVDIYGSFLRGYLRAYDKAGSASAPGNG